MKRLILIAAALSLVLAACGGSGGSAASVDGTEITTEEVEQLAGSTFDESYVAFAQALSTLVNWTITEQAAEADFGYTPTEAEVEEQIALVLDDAGFESLEAMGETQGVSAETLRRYIVLLMTQDAVVEALEANVEAPDEATVSQEREANPAAWTTVCASHLLVATEAEASTALERIRGGEGFAAVAAEVSTDPGSATAGGDLGCQVAATYVEPFANAAMEAEIDTPTEPVESEFGFHVILVSERTEATDEDISRVLTDRVLAEAGEAWYLGAAARADVFIDERYGTWVTDPSPQVLPPVQSG